METYYLFLSDTLNQVSTVTAFKWILLGFVCILVIGLMYLEQRRMQRYYHRLTSAASSQDTAALDYSLRLLTRLSRSILLLSIAFIILTFSIITYDIKKHNINTMRLIMEDKAWCDSKLSIGTAITEKAPLAANPVLSQPPSEESTEPPPPQHNAAAPREDQAKQLDQLKEQYEKTFINYYILQKCGLASVNDALVISDALMREMSHHNAPYSFRSTVLNTAKSTYSALYKETDCEDPTLQETTQAHLAYIEGLRQTLNPQFTSP